MAKKWFALFIFLISLPLPAFAGFSISATVSVCGNNTIDGTEHCDGSNLGGETCVSRGYNSGSLSCASSCIFNISNCASGGGGGGSGGGGGGGGGAYLVPAEAKVLLQGKAYPAASITILVDGKVSAFIKADPQAVFKAEITNLTAGIYNFGLWAEDSAGRRSIAHSFTVTVIANVVTTISNIFLPPTIELNKVNLAKEEALDISGQTAPESKITISVESSQEIIKTTTADKKGAWNNSFDTEPLEEGGHTVRAKAEDIGGVLSSFSKVLSFFIGKYKIQEIYSKADFNKDGKTNLIDFSVLLYWWGKPQPGVDLNQGGKVNLTDFSILMYYWTG